MSLWFSLHQPETITCPHCKGQVPISNGETEIFDINITHNLGHMAGEAGIYEVLWRPDEHGYQQAKDIIEILEQGYAQLLADPQRFKPFEASNGWGLYEHFVPFVARIIDACKASPEAAIHASR